MSWPRLTLDELIEQSLADIDANLDDADPRLPVSILSVLAIVTSGQTDGLYGYIARIARQIPWVDADSDTLERWASLVGSKKKKATAAGGTVAVSKSTPGARVPVDTVLQRADGVDYIVTAEATVGADGAAAVTVAALDPGSAGNAAAGVKLAPGETLAGIVSPLVVGADGLTGGVNVESDESLLERFLEYWKAAEELDGPYARLAKKVAGVTRAWEYGQEMGLGTITVRFVMDAKPDTIIPTEAEITTVEAYMQTYRPPGSKALYVVAPVPDPLDITLAVSPDTSAVRAAIEAEVDDFVKREHEPGDPTILSRLSEAISAADGEYAHRLISPTETVTRAAYQIAVPGTITWEAFA